MKKSKLLLLIIFTVLRVSLFAQTPVDLGEKPLLKRMLWASINGRSDATYTKNPELKKILQSYNNKILISWRMFPTDDETTGFDLYRKSGNNVEVKLNTTPIVKTTNFQDATANRSVDNTYRLCYAGSNETIESYTITAAQASEGLPYISIPLQSDAGIDPNPNVRYLANDASVGDLDGDGENEIVIKRLASFSAIEDGDETAVNSSLKSVFHLTLLEAYKLDGTFLWRICLGPNILIGNSLSFAVYDFDGDGKCEVAFRTSEGTRFGDGTEIGDVDGDGIIDYRRPDQVGVNTNYIGAGPEFLSVVEGATGKELARTDYIARGTSEEWGDDYYKRASSYRLGVGRFSSTNSSILITRGVYAKSVLEAWDFKDGTLTKRWRFDTSDGVHGAYAGQGFHSLSIGDVDGDGFDEVVYGSCTIDHDGKGLNSSGLGHGDALHLGKFDPSREGLQIWSCFETGSVGAAFRDAQSGDIIWKYNDSSDVGRALVADIDPDSPGCEMWWFRGNAHSSTGEDLGYKPSSCNMAIWWTGSLNRQLLNESSINSEIKGDYNRMFTIYRYDVTTVNGTKSNPCFYGDILGDWREEIIMVTKDYSELRVFSTWYPCDYKFPYLMSDHVYEMSALNQNIGYNQPTQLGYYLGSDLIKNDTSIRNSKNIDENKIILKILHYNLFGYPISIETAKGIIIEKIIYEDGSTSNNKIFVR